MDAECLLERSDFRHRLLEAALAEKLHFLLLEFFILFVVFHGRNKEMESREENGILPVRSLVQCGSLRAVHSLLANSLKYLQQLATGPRPLDSPEHPIVAVGWNGWHRLGISHR